MLPRELTLEILLFLRDGKTLAKCALVCSEWLPFAREVLYRSDAFVLPFKKRKWRSVRRAIKNPSVSRILRRVVIDAYDPYNVDEMAAQAKLVFKYCSNVKTLETTYSRWTALEPLIRKLGSICQKTTSLHLGFLKYGQSSVRVRRRCDPAQLLPALKAATALRPNHVRYSHLFSSPLTKWKFTRPFPFRLVKAELLRCQAEADELRLLLGDSTETLHSLVLDNYRDLFGGYMGLSLAVKPFAGCLRELSLLQCELRLQYKEDDPFAMETLIGMFTGLELLDVEGFLIVSSMFLEQSLSTSIRSLRLVPFDWGFRYILSREPEDAPSRLYPPINVDGWVKYLTGERSHQLEHLELGLTSDWSDANVERIKLAASPKVELKCCPPQNRPRWFGIGDHIGEGIHQPGCMRPRPCIPTSKELEERPAI